MADPWQVLGIPPTKDEAEIRRAYAERLKATRPDVDPEGFRALRAAFDAARAGAARRVVVTPSRDDVLAPAPHETISAPIVTAAPEIREHIRAGRLLDAAAAWAQAVRASAIGFDDQDRLQIELARNVPALELMSLSELYALIEMMDWERTGNEIRAPEAIVDVLRRRDALLWIGGMREDAAARWVLRPLRRRRRKAARLLLREAPGPLAKRFPYRLSLPDFDYWLNDLPLHRRFLPGFPDPARLAWCRAVQKRLDAVLLRRFWWLNLCTFFLPLAILFNFFRVALKSMFGS